MQTRILGWIGTHSLLTLLCVVSGGAAKAHAGQAGMPGDGSAGSSGASKFAEMKVSVDTVGGRLIVVIPPIMKSIGADFTIDADVKNAIVASHLTNVKLQVALDSLLRVSDIPVQVKFEKGVYHFSKRVDPIPEVLPQPPLNPGESVLPPPPTTVEGDVDVRNVQTYDLLRVLNGLFGVPIAIDPSRDPGNHAQGAPTYPGLGQGTDTGHGNVSSNGIGGNRSIQYGNQSNRDGSNVTLFGHTFHFNNIHGNGR